MSRSYQQAGDDKLMKESSESWEVLQVPSASGGDIEEEKLVTVSQLNLPPKPKKEASLERLLIEAQRESLQSSARQSVHHSKHSSPVFPDSPAESGDYYLPYDEFNRQRLLSPSAADGSTDWFWDWNFITNAVSKVEFQGQYVRRVPRKMSSVKRKFLGLLLLTNFLALILGAGLGYYLGKKILAGQEANHNEWDIISQVESGMFKYY
jgi:hypothetical protein